MQAGFGEFRPQDLILGKEEDNAFRQIAAGRSVDEGCISSMDLVLLSDMCGGVGVVPPHGHHDAAPER